MDANLTVRCRSCGDYSDECNGCRDAGSPLMGFERADGDRLCDHVE